MLNLLSSAHFGLHPEEPKISLSFETRAYHARPQDEEILSVPKEGGMSDGCGMEKTPIGPSGHFPRKRGKNSRCTDVRRLSSPVNGGGVCEADGGGSLCD